MGERSTIQTISAFTNAGISVSEALLQLISTMAKSYYDDRTAHRFAKELDKRLEDVKATGGSYNSVCGFFRYENSEDAFKAQERLFYNGIPSSIIEINNQPHIVVMQDRALEADKILNQTLQYTDDDRQAFESHKKLYGTDEYNMENEPRADDFEKSLIYSHVMYERDGLKFTVANDFETQDKINDIKNKVSEMITERCGILGEIKDQKSLYAKIVKNDIIEKSSDKSSDFYVIDASSPTKILHVNAAGLEKMEVGNLEAEKNSDNKKSADGIGVSLEINGVKGVYSRGASQGDEAKFQQTLSKELQSFKKPMIVNKNVILEIDKEYENSYNATLSFRAKVDKVFEKRDFNQSFALVDRTNPDRMMMVNGDKFILVANKQTTEFDLKEVAGRREAEKKLERMAKQIERGGNAALVSSGEEMALIKEKIENRTTKLKEIGEKLNSKESFTVISTSNPDKIICVSESETNVYIGDRRFSISKEHGKDKEYREKVMKEIEMMNNINYKEGLVGSDLRKDVVIERRKNGGRISNERYEQIVQDKYKFDAIPKTPFDNKVQTTTSSKINQYSQESKIYATYQVSKSREIKQGQVSEIEKVERMCANLYEKMKAEMTRDTQEKAKIENKRNLYNLKDSVYKAENIRVFANKTNSEQSFLDFFKDNIKNANIENAKSVLATDCERIENLPDELQRYAEEYFDQLQKYEEDPLGQNIISKQENEREEYGSYYDNDINNNGIDDSLEEDIIRENN